MGKMINTAVGTVFSAREDAPSHETSEQRRQRLLRALSEYRTAVDHHLKIDPAHFQQVSDALRNEYDMHLPLPQTALRPDLGTTLWPFTNPFPQPGSSGTPPAQPRTQPRASGTPPAQPRAQQRASGRVDKPTMGTYQASYDAANKVVTVYENGRKLWTYTEDAYQQRVPILKMPDLSLLKKAAGGLATFNQTKELVERVIRNSPPMTDEWARTNDTRIIEDPSTSPYNPNYRFQQDAPALVKWIIDRAKNLGKTQ